ncbi:VPA1262 family N-terminal domain-containing protein [Azonexus sp. IMCC34839]|uniref:VPA1262 family N-terminal domain-containing protein n=1 Tax=Azonexus sp. IMCC34839 TaxID=3133695 RepID=UPI00399ADD49
MPGTLGFYTHCEVTEIVGFSNDDPSIPVNVLTVVVLEDRAQDLLQEFSFLNSGKRIELPSLKGWNFGVARYTKLLSELEPTLQHLDENSAWRLSGKSLALGDMAAIAPQFVPPDASESAQLNQVLKNNFWNGSYVLEWFDTDKQNLQDLIRTPHCLQELSEAMHRYVPISLASISERLGNLIVQIPVTVIMSDFRKIANQGLVVEVAWHPKAASRKLHATATMEFDGAICGYSATEIVSSETTLPAYYDSSGLNRLVLWDAENQVVLAASGPLAYLETLSMRSGIIDPEPRVFTITRSNGAVESHRIGIQQHYFSNQPGEVNDQTPKGWIRRRRFSAETLRLMKERRFVQYHPKQGKRDEERQRALDDVRFLINRYGEYGAWLWDPYLSAIDILDTLFHCTHSDADLKALTALQVPSSSEGKSRKLLSALLKEQRAILDNVDSNYRGLRLEYRTKGGSAGRGFHDRFLIFPDTQQGTLAWSLGTSINSLGMEHHILQRVDNGELIKEAFLDLWDQLSQPEHLVWKKP